MDLLTTYTHDSELQAITAPPLISTIHKSPQHPLSLFLGCYMLPLTIASNSGDASASRAQILFSQPPVQNCPNNWLCPLLITSQRGPRRNTPFRTVTLLLHAYSLQRERVYRAVAPKRSLFTESSFSNGSVRHNIKMDLRERESAGGMEIIDLAQDRDQCMALANAVMNPRVS
jgi:hypothetical protein